jgi:hypothetical protein
MAERLIITAMGRQRLVERIRDRIWTAIYNLPLNATDEQRADYAASAVMLEGEYQDIPDIGSWHDKAQQS